MHECSDSWQYTQKVLNHRIGLGERRSFEALANFAFPSTAEIHLSTLLLDKITLLSANQNMNDFLAALVSIVISLWARCVKEEYVSVYVQGLLYRVYAAGI